MRTRSERSNFNALQLIEIIEDLPLESQLLSHHLRQNLYKYAGIRFYLSHQTSDKGNSFRFVLKLLICTYKHNFNFEHTFYLEQSLIFMFLIGPRAQTACRPTGPGLRFLFRPSDFSQQYDSYILEDTSNFLQQFLTGLQKIKKNFPLGLKCR